MTSTAPSSTNVTALTNPVGSGAGGASPLPEQTPLGEPAGVVRADLHVRGSEQEHPTGDLVDGPAQCEGQPGGEVDQPLGSGVVQLGQVHDHGHAVAVALADRAGLVVAARLQGS